MLRIAVLLMVVGSVCFGQFDPETSICIFRTWPTEGRWHNSGRPPSSSSILIPRSPRT